MEIWIELAGCHGSGLACKSLMFPLILMISHEARVMQDTVTSNTLLAVLSEALSQ